MITDTTLRSEILKALANPCAGEQRASGLCEAVSLSLRNYGLQVRRIGRIANEMANEGLIQVRTTHGYFVDTAIFSAK